MAEASASGRQKALVISSFQWQIASLLRTFYYWLIFFPAVARIGQTIKMRPGLTKGSVFYKRCDSGDRPNARQTSQTQGSQSALLHCFLFATSPSSALYKILKIKFVKNLQNLHWGGFHLMIWCTPPTVSEGRGNSVMWNMRKFSDVCLKIIFWGSLFVPIGLLICL